MLPTGRPPAPGAGQFEQMQATSLYCPRCKKATPVRQKLLLVLPAGDKYSYSCAVCGEDVGSKLEKGNPENPWTNQFK